ncbi:MAG: four helix bundle protein [wastewater metagenome]|nr:four helix bundle protein [Candidatus Loosdrechtia aerotolerans]
MKKIIVDTNIMFSALLGKSKKIREKLFSSEDIKPYSCKYLIVELFKNKDKLIKNSATFPKFELYELGSQLRRSSNSSPANIAEGWNNKHINIYLEGINRALGEIRETRHHIKMASRKGYIEQTKLTDLINR